MDQSVNAMLKMIEQAGASLAKKAELCKQTRPDLIGEIEEFYSSYGSLAERYDHLNAELYKSIPLGLQMQDADSAPDTAMATPDRKLGLDKNAGQVAYVSSGGASSDLSLKDGSDSSPSSSSDSESESFNSSGNAYYSLPANNDHKGLHRKIIGLGTDLSRLEVQFQLDSEDNGESVFNAQENGNSEELLGKIMRYEEELRDSKLQFLVAQEEVARLKSELEKSESFLVLAETLQGQLESANRDIKTREADLEVERRKVMELQKQIAKNTHEMEGHLKFAQDEISMLRTKLETESQNLLDLQERSVICENDLSDRDNEVKTLKLALINTENNFLAEQSHLQSNISSLSERESLLDARIKELEIRCKTMEDKLRQCETEKVELQLIHETQIIGLRGEISQLKVVLRDRSGHVEILNKQLDSIKFKNDMLEAEKDGINAKVNTLIADVSSRDNRIEQMEEHLRRVQMENGELIARSESSQKVAHELRMRIVELEKEVDKQRSELCAGAEEKREAIRQLCFSLDHYKSGYRVLCQAFVQHKRHAIMAS